MTLPRTIHRRAARKRAKALAERRKAGPQYSFMGHDLITREAVDAFVDNLKAATLMNRKYDGHS